MIPFLILVVVTLALRGAGAAGLRDLESWRACLRGGLAAIGLLIRGVAPVAAACLAVLLVALFPANVRAARERLMLGGRPATPLALRTMLQIVCIAALVAAGFPEMFGLS